MVATRVRMAVAMAGIVLVLSGLGGAGARRSEAGEKAVAPAATDPPGATTRTSPEYQPAATLEEDIKTLAEVSTVKGYAQKHPRLLLEEKDKTDLLRRKEALPPKVWDAILKQAEGLRTVPDGNAIRKGSGYTRAERMLSGALASYLVGNKARLHVFETVVRQNGIDLTGRKDVKSEGIEVVNTLGEPTVGAAK